MIMAFPGRSPQGKGVSVRTYSCAIGVVLLLIWVVWTAIQDVRNPLPPPEKVRIPAIDQDPGLVRKTADRFGDDVHQILRADPLKRAPERIYQSRAVVFNKLSSVRNNASNNYYSGR